MQRKKKRLTAPVVVLQKPNGMDEQSTYHLNIMKKKNTHTHTTNKKKRKKEDEKMKR